MATKDRGLIIVTFKIETARSRIQEITKSEGLELLCYTEMKWVGLGPKLTLIITRGNAQELVEKLSSFPEVYEAHATVDSQLLNTNKKEAAHYLKEGTEKTQTTQA